MKYKTKNEKNIQFYYKNYKWYNDKNIVNLKRINVKIQNEIDNLEDDKHIIETKKVPTIPKENSSNIHQQTNEFRKLITFDLINNKFDLSLMISSYILEPNLTPKNN